MSIPGVSPEHCSNPEEHQPHSWQLGHCDGSEVRMPPGMDEEPPPVPEMGPATLWGAPGHPVPWNLAGLSEADLDDVTVRLRVFAAHYNRVYAVRDDLLVLGCWELHPAVWWELASLHAAWVDAFDSATATAREAASWHERLLPHFQDRLPRWFGTGTVGCTVSAHADDWNPTSAKLDSLAQVGDRLLDRAVAARRDTIGGGLSPHPR